MAKLSQSQRTQTQRAIIYGGPKTGKSLLAGELAEYYDLVWVDLENGHETLFQLPEAWQDRIELVNLPDTRSYPIAIETVLKMVKTAVTICEAHGKVSCMQCKKKEAPAIDIDLPSLGHNHVVVFDSLTQLSNSAISHITKGQPDDYKLDYNDWGNLGKLLDIFLSHIQQAKYNVIVISHETEAESEGKKKSLVPVGGTRAFSRNVAKYFDHVVYAERKNKKHVFSSSTSYATNILCGSRSDIDIGGAEGTKPSLLQIFKPELYGSSQAAKESKPTLSTLQTTGGNNSAKDVLARLRETKK